MSENDFDQQTANEMNAISAMIKFANAQGLLCEVIYTFGQYRYNGDDVFKSTRDALNEWDC